MQDSGWLGYVTAIGSVATPVLVLALTAAGWKYRKAVERRLELEDQLRGDRIATYNEILEPFILLLMPSAAWESDERNRGIDKDATALRKLLSLDYRKQAFKLSLVGSDDVVRAYNELMQFSYSLGGMQDPASVDPSKLMGLLGTFLLEIRRSMGNTDTTLDNWQMLEWFIKDVRRLRDA